MNLESSRFPMTKLVVLFNWHFFLIAAVACVAGIIAFAIVPILWIRVVLAIGVISGIYFIVASVIASYFVYDHSDLYRLERWPDRVIPEGATAAALVHAGFDPASQKLIRKYPHLAWSVLDFFDSETTTETSIRTARMLFPAAKDEMQIKATQWPLHDKSQDVIFSISAAHEIRNNEERAAFFQEARRCLKPTGRMVVIEQLRDSRNFMVFGAAVLHFLSHRTWSDSFEAGGLKTIDEFWMSPWMKTFVLTPQE